MHLTRGEAHHREARHRAARVEAHHRAARLDGVHRVVQDKGQQDWERHASLPASKPWTGKSCRNGRRVQSDVRSPPTVTVWNQRTMGSTDNPKRSTTEP